MTWRLPVGRGGQLFLRVDRKGYNQKVAFNQRPRAIEFHVEAIISADFRGRRVDKDQQCGQRVHSQVMQGRGGTNEIN